MDSGTRPLWSLFKFIESLLSQLSHPELLLIGFVYPKFNLFAEPYLYLYHRGNVKLHCL